MTKRTMLISSVLLTIGIGTFVFYNVSNDNEIIESTNRDNLKVNSNALTMMYEIEADSGEYQVSSDTMWPEEGYTFNAELSKCENGSKLSWDDENKRVVMQANTSDKCYVYFDIYVEPTLADVCPDGGNLASCIQTYYITYGEETGGLYHHDGIGSYINADQEAGDNSYRYVGANPNNYVCFGSDEATCPTDNLYRIIGVFENQVKLIKHDYAGSDLLGENGDFSNSSYTEWWSSSSYYKGSLSQSSVSLYYWNRNGSNTWSASQLNTVNLNTNYLNNIGNTWSSKIANHTWQVGGATYANVYSSPVKTAYNYEVGANTANTTYNAKIGLMYVSDYGYAASPANWSTNMGSLNTSTNRDNNWMFMGLYEWTISRTSDGTANPFLVNDTGYVYSYNVDIGDAVRPSFYLQPWVLYSRGDGTQENPYRISAPDNLISFTLIDTVYYAEDGMTWNEWIDSIYCADKSLFYIDVGPYNQFVNYKDEPFAAEFKYYAMGNDLIINGAKYKRSTQPYG